jgi:4-amino-4-deoxy-L-arabinose transferase-like glycosyltransferase
LLGLRRNRYVELAVVLAVCAFLFFYGLGSFGFVGADEPRYAQIGAEMLARHDWIVPTLNGTPWLEKPALLYWSEMMSYAVFGVHDWAARLPVALMTTAMVLAIYFFVRRRFSEWALDAAMIAAATVGAIGFGRAASTDMPLTACLTIALLGWLEWFAGRSRNWLLMFYFYCALGMLAKGPVAPFLAGLIILLFAAILKRGKLITGTLWWPGIFLFLAVSLPWYIAVQIKTGDFFRVFILQHNLERFGTNLYQHRQPFWYYIPVVLALLMPWAAMFLAEVVEILRGIRTKLLGNPEALFLALWFLVPVLFFSASVSKLPGYVLPSVPAAALLIVAYLRDKEESGLAAVVAILHGLFCGALFAGVLLAPHFLLRVRPSAAAITWAVGSGALMLVLGAVTLLRRGMHYAHAVTLIPIVLGIAFIIRVASPAIDTTQSARPVAQEIRSFGYPENSPVLLFHVRREIEYGLPFYRHAAAVAYEGGPLRVNPAMIITSAASIPVLAGKLPRGTVLTHMGSFPRQRLEFYLAVSRQ